jgi:hypothetical protein
MSATPTDAPQGALRALVERFRVCWDSFPEWSQIGGERKQTGAIVEIYGTHDLPGVVPTAGCKHCIPVIQALLTIADHVVSGARRDLVSIRAHSGIEYAVERGARPDIVVALTFGLPDGETTVEVEAPLDEVRQRLQQLGARERSWQGGRS